MIPATAIHIASISTTWLLIGLIWWMNRPVRPTRSLNRTRLLAALAVSAALVNLATAVALAYNWYWLVLRALSLLFTLLFLRRAIAARMPAATPRHDTRS